VCLGGTSNGISSSITREYIRITRVGCPNGKTFSEKWRNPQIETGPMYTKGN
jgi:hypothetical protein